MSDTNFALTRIMELKQVENSAAGNITVNHTAVPLGECWVITAIDSRDESHAVTRIEINTSNVWPWCTLAKKLAPAAGESIHWDGKLVLRSGDRISVIFTGVTAGGYLYSSIFGYRIPQFATGSFNYE